jgi:hypothetical protein
MQHSAYARSPIVSRARNRASSPKRNAYLQWDFQALAHIVFGVAENGRECDE